MLTTEEDPGRGAAPSARETAVPGAGETASPRQAPSTEEAAPSPSAQEAAPSLSAGQAPSPGQPFSPPEPPSPGADAPAEESLTSTGKPPGRRLALTALLSAVLIALHAHLPDTALNLGSLFQTLLPWTGLAVPVLLALAAVRRSRLAAVAVLAPALVWATLLGPTLIDKRSTGHGLTVLSHNVDEANPDPAGTARALAGAKADLLALVELSHESAPVYERELAAAYPHHTVLGGVGLWSRYRLSAVAVVEIMPWTRAMRATAATPKGPVAVYAAHLASVRVSAAGFTTGRRNEAARALAAAVRAETTPRVVVLGDFNGTYQDRALAPVTSQLRSAQREAGSGFGFTYPAGFPVVRIDDVLVKGLTPLASWTLPATGSDHRPVAATLRL